MKVAAPGSTNAHFNAHRRMGGLLAILLTTVCVSLIVFQLQMGMKGDSNNSSRVESVETNNPKCKGKERVFGILQRATKQSIDEKKCHIPNLLKVSRTSRSIKKKKAEPLVYNKTTCELSDMCDQLPKWKQVRHNYGEDAVVIGMETCKKYRDSLHGSNATVRIAGLYNAGTHALAAALQDNLPHLNPHNQTHWDVVWGKHVPLKYRNENVWPPEDTVLTPNQILPVVIVRDPFRWMQAMCKANYDADWKLAPHRHCPNLVPIPRDFATPLRHSTNSKSYKVRVQLHQTGYRHTEQYDSLAHMWTEWHQQYYDTDIPRLMVRFEDFLFHRERVLEQIAECATGQAWSRPVKYRVASVKDHGSSSDLVSAALKYGTSRGRYAGMAAEDLRFAKTALSPKLLKMFNYLEVPTV